MNKIPEVASTPPPPGDNKSYPNDDNLSDTQSRFPDGRRYRRGNSSRYSTSEGNISPKRSSRRKRKDSRDRWGELSDNEDDSYKKYLAKVKREPEENSPPPPLHQVPSPSPSFSDKAKAMPEEDLQNLRMRLLQKMTRRRRPGGGTIGESPQELPAAPAAKNEKYKSRLCVLWARGKLCRFLDQCHFAHGEHEILKKHSRTREDDPLVKQHPRICEDFLAGSCRNGDECQLPHVAGISERDAPRAKRIKLGQEKGALVPRNKKANICKHFLKNQCLWGTSCSFSHDLTTAASLAEISSEGAEDILPEGITASSLQKIFGLKAGIQRNQVAVPQTRQVRSEHDEQAREIEMLKWNLKALESENKGLKSECKLLNLKLRMCQCGARDL